MDTTALEHAYKALLDVARAGAATAATAPVPVEQQLAQAVVVDRLLAQATAELLAGQTPRYSDAPAQHGPLLDEIARSAEGPDGLIAEVRRGGLVLVRLVRQLDDATAATPVPTRLVSGGAVRLDAPMPWSGVLNTHAEVDLPARAQRLEDPEA